MIVEDDHGLTEYQKEDKAGDVTWIVGGGAYHASDKIIQHNGCGKVNVSISSHSACRHS